VAFNTTDWGVLDGSKTVTIQDNTNADLINLRRIIYLTIMSSVNFEECVHKLMKLDIREGQEVTLSFFEAALLTDL
jgi:pre-mRNA-splicing factor CWC22